MDVRWVLGAPGRGREAYAVGHIPGAMFVDLDTDLAAPSGPGRHPLPDPAAFRRRMEQLGVRTDDEVVAYDDVGGSVAARLWWMLDNLGHRRAAVTDGGVPRVVAAGLPIDRGPLPVPVGAEEPPPRRRLDEDDRSRRRRGCAPGRSCCSMPEPPRATAAEVEPVDPCPATSRPRSAPRRVATWSRWAAAQRRRARRALRSLGATGRMAPWWLVRERRDGLLHQPGHAVAGLPTRSCTPVRTATGRDPDCPSRWVRSPAIPWRDRRLDSAAGLPDARPVLPGHERQVRVRVVSATLRAGRRSRSARPRDGGPQSLPATVAAWSDGLAALEPLDVIEVRRPLATLVVERRWPLVGRPARLSPELVERAGWPLRLHPWSCGRAPRTWQCGWGCTIGPTPETRQGRVHVDLDGDHWPTLATDRPRPRAMSTSGSAPVERSIAGWGRRGRATGLHGPAVHLDPRPAGAAVRSLLHRIPRRFRRPWRSENLGTLVPRLDDRPAPSDRAGRCRPPHRPHPGTLGAPLDVSDPARPSDRRAGPRDPDARRPLARPADHGWRRRSIGGDRHHQVRCR